MFLFWLCSKKDSDDSTLPLGAGGRMVELYIYYSYFMVEVINNKEGRSPWH